MPSMRRLAVTTLGIGAAQFGKGQHILNEAGSRKPDDLAEDQDRGTLQLKPLGRGGELGKCDGHPALGVAARILHCNDRAGRLPARVEQPVRDQAGGRYAHIDEQRAFSAAKSGKIEMIEARLIAPGLVAGNEGHAMRDIAMGKRHLQARGSGKPCGDAGGDLDLDAGVAQRCDLLAGATEHERIAALEPHDGLTRSRALDHQLLNLFLEDAMLALRFADWNQLDLAAGMFEHAGAGKPVIENNICDLQCAHGLEGQQLGIAGARTDEKDAAVRRLGLHRGVDGFADQPARFVLLTSERSLARRAIEHPLPEFAAWTPGGELLRHRVAKIAGKTRERIETWMKLTLEPGAQTLSEHR